MTDADTPSMPNFWWSSEHGEVLEKYYGSYVSLDGQSTLDTLPADAVQLGPVKAAFKAGMNDGIQDTNASSQLELEALRAELDENEGVIRVLRRQRDEAEHERDAECRTKPVDWGLVREDYSSPDEVAELLSERDARIESLEDERDALSADVRGVLNEVMPDIDLGDGQAGYNALDRIRAILDREPGGKPSGNVAPRAKPETGSVGESVRERPIKFAPGVRVRKAKAEPDDPSGTIVRRWTGAKGDVGWLVQWDGFDECDEDEEKIVLDRKPGDKS